MPARNAKNPFFPCILLGLGLAFATPQDSLYEKALDAEGAGDVATAIHLFEMANSYPGNYNAEIQEILTEYYEALQIGRDSGSGEKELSFWANLEAGGSRYDELGDSLGAHEFFGEGGLRIGAELFIPQGELFHRIAVFFASDVFFYEPNTVFDTSRVALSPSVEYSLSGDRFAASLESGVLFSAREHGTFFVSFWGKRDFYRNEASRAGFRGDFFWNSQARVRLSAGSFFEISREKGFSMEVAFLGRFDGDTSVSAYFKYALRDDFERGGPFPWDVGLDILPDSASERFYLGRRSKFGPEICAFLEYRFSHFFSLDFRENLFFSYGPQEDRWLRDAERIATWNRRMLQGNACLRANFEWERFGMYVSAGIHFSRYFRLPEDHPEISAELALQEKARLGSFVRF